MEREAHVGENMLKASELVVYRFPCIQLFVIFQLFSEANKDCHIVFLHKTVKNASWVTNQQKLWRNKHRPSYSGL